MGTVLGSVVAAAARAAMLYTLRHDRRGKVRVAGAANLGIFLCPTALLGPTPTVRIAAAAAAVVRSLGCRGRRNACGWREPQRADVSS